MRWPVGKRVTPFSSSNERAVCWQAMVKPTIRAIIKTPMLGHEFHGIQLLFSIFFIILV